MRVRRGRANCVDQARVLCAVRAMLRRGVRAGRWLVPHTVGVCFAHAPLLSVGEYDI